MPPTPSKRAADIPFEILFPCCSHFLFPIFTKVVDITSRMIIFQNLAETMNVGADSAGSQNILVA